MTDSRERYVQHAIQFGTAGKALSEGIRNAIAALDENAAEVAFKANLKKLVDSHAHALRILMASAVANFNCYLVEALREVLDVEPRPLASKTIPLKEVFSATDISDLKARAIDRFLLDLGYQSVEQLSDFFEQQLGVKTLSKKLTQRRLNRIIQMRNIVAHNRGIANPTFLSRSGSKRDQLGQYIWVPHPVQIARYLDRLVFRIDAEIEAKFFPNSKTSAADA